MVNESSGENPIKIDPLNPGEKTLITYASPRNDEAGPKEVLCRIHFFKRVKKEGNRFYGGYTYIEGMEAAPPDEPCFDCVNNS